MAWGDYAIVEVRYDNDHSRIVKVKRKKVNHEEESLSLSVEKSRQAVIDDIESGSKYTTALKKQNGNWRLGEDIHVIPVNGEQFLRTDQNNEPEDNLGELPEF